MLIDFTIACTFFGQNVRYLYYMYVMRTICTLFDIIVRILDTRGAYMIRIHLSKAMGEKRLTQMDLSKKTGIRRATINEYYNELTDRINLIHFDTFCEVLECDLMDLLEYIPNKKET